MTVKQYDNTLSIADKLLLFLSGIYMLHQTPYFGVRIPAMFFAGVIVVLFCYVGYVFSRNNSIIKYLLPVFAIYFLDCIIKMNTLPTLYEKLQLISNVLQALILPILAGYVVKERKTKLGLYLVATYFLLEFAIWLSSIFAEMLVPGMIRMNPGELMEDDSAMYAMKMDMNCGSFDTVYGCACLLPICIIVIKWRKELLGKWIYSFFAIVITLVMIYFIYVSQFAIALVFSLFLSLTILCPKKMTAGFFKKSILGVLIIAVSFSSMLPVMLHKAASLSGSEIVAERFEGLAVSMEGNESSGVNDVDNRKDTYTTSLKTIQSTYLLGGWGEAEIGGHSLILDDIAKYGILGIILLVVYYKSLLRLFYEPYKKEPWVYFYLYGLMAITFFYIFNPGMLASQLLFCYPLSAFLINYKLNKNDKYGNTVDMP